MVGCGGKCRSEQINVRLSPEDRELLRKAVAILYPGLDVSNSSALLALARQRAQQVLDDDARKQVHTNFQEFMTQGARLSDPLTLDRPRKKK